GQIRGGGRHLTDGHHTNPQSVRGCVEETEDRVEVRGGLHRRKGLVAGRRYAAEHRGRGSQDTAPVISHECHRQVDSRRSALEWPRNESRGSVLIPGQGRKLKVT